MNRRISSQLWETTTDSSLSVAPPGSQGASENFGLRSPADSSACSPRLCEDQGLQEGVAGQAVGAVQPGAGHFPDGIEAPDVGPPVFVGRHPAAHVVGRGNHGDRLPGDVDLVLQAGFIDVGEPLPDELRRPVADVQVRRRDPRSFSAPGRWILPRRPGRPDPSGVVSVP